jgi:hypothetical protein
MRRDGRRHHAVLDRLQILRGKRHRFQPDLDLFQFAAEPERRAVVLAVGQHFVERKAEGQRAPGAAKFACEALPE